MTYAMPTGNSAERSVVYTLLTQEMRGNYMAGSTRQIARICRALCADCLAPDTL